MFLCLGRCQPFAPGATSDVSFIQVIPSNSNPLCPLSLSREFPFHSGENCGAEAALSCWAFPPCTPPPHTSRGPVSGQVHPSGSCFLKTVRFSTSNILHAFVLAAWLPKPISLTASRWQHVPPSALRLD